MSVSISHIDTCMACYLTDHHNREGEYLVGVPVDGETTVWEVRREVESELASVELPESITGDMILEALDAEFGARCEEDQDGDGSAVLFDSTLEIDGEDDDNGESAQAWFLLSWSAE